MGKRRREVRKKVRRRIKKPKRRVRKKKRKVSKRKRRVLGAAKSRRRLKTVRAIARRRLSTRLTVPELAAHFSVSIPTIRKWRRKGLPCRTGKGRLLLFSVREVERWLLYGK